MKVQESFVDSHFKAIPSVGSFSGRRFAGSHSQELGGHADGSGDWDFLVESALFVLRTRLFKVLEVSRSQCETNAMENLLVLIGGLDILLDGRSVRHVALPTGAK